MILLTLRLKFTKLVAVAFIFYYFCVIHRVQSAILHSIRRVLNVLCIISRCRANLWIYMRKIVYLVRTQMALAVFKTIVFALCFVKNASYDYSREKWNKLSNHFTESLNRSLGFLLLDNMNEWIIIWKNETDDYIHNAWRSSRSSGWWEILNSQAKSVYL